MKAVQVTSKYAVIHDIAKTFQVNVEFLDRRWWELRPRMRVRIPWNDLTQLNRIHGKVLGEVIHRGYSQRHVHITIGGQYVEHE